MNMIRQSIAGLLLLLAFTVVFGLGYPLLMTGVGQVAFHDQANGSIVQYQGHDVGSSLLGQEFKGAQWFQPRPSAASYDALASGGTNLGPNNPDLVKAIQKAQATIAAQDGVSPSQVPPDAVTSSGSGLDPHISPAYADLQVARVAQARGMSVSDVQKLVDDHTQGRILGFLGEPRVNVLELNLALAQAASGTTGG
jgi:K+-transporting ATPase ATPase C chain